MMRFRNSLYAFVLLATPATLLAGTIPYPNPGTIAATSTITATATGDVTGYYIQGGAGTGQAKNSDSVELIDITTGTSSGFQFPNQTTSFGASVDFGTVNAGDLLEFLLYDATTGEYLSSLPSDSSDGENHAYVTSFAGGTLTDEDFDTGTFVAGTYVGMEDHSTLDASHDFNYTDDSFVFTDVNSTPQTLPGVTPEPSSLILLGTGVLSVAGAVRRRRSL